MGIWNLFSTLQRLACIHETANLSAEPVVGARTFVRPPDRFIVKQTFTVKTEKKCRRKVYG